MPVQKFSAMDPSGSWNMDARDQTAMWNADRGDRINMWQTNRMDQRGQDDWRKEIALKQLGLTEKGMNWNREDTAAERAAKYGFMGEELGLRREESAANRGLQERGFSLQERGMNMQLSEAERLAKERADEAASLDAMDFSQLGINAGAAKAAPRGLKAQIAAQMLTRGLDKAQRPEDRAARGEDVRGSMALQNLAQLEQKGQVTPREAALYAQASAESQKQGYGGTGGLAPQTIQAQEFTKEQARSLIAKAKELGGGAFGYVSEDDVAVISQQAQDLASMMERAGYPAQDINSVMDSIAAELGKTRSGLLIKEGWGGEDIQSALGSGRRAQ
jgi:hypothetical protein